MASLVSLVAALVGGAAVAETSGQRSAGLCTEPEPWVERCAREPTLRGIDVSDWQGEIDWVAVRASGIRFAFVRVSDGATAPDPAFARNWAAAARAGVSRGAYQFFRPAEDPEEQADLFLEMVGSLHKGDLPPALDVEVSGDLEPAEIVARIERWVRRVGRVATVRPIVYTSALHWLELAGNSRRFRHHCLWVAHHGADCPNVPCHWQRWSFHQSSASGHVAGIAGVVDEDRFQGNASALRRLTVRDGAAASVAWRRWKRHRDRASSVSLPLVGPPTPSP